MGTGPYFMRRHLYIRFFALLLLCTAFCHLAAASELKQKTTTAFDRYVAATEARGGVPEMLRTLSRHYEARQSLMRQARTAMIYPVAVLIVAACVVALITIWLLPMFISLLRDISGRKAADFGETLEGDPSSFAYPGAKHDFVAEGGGCLVIDLVAQDYPADRVARGRGSGRFPVRGGDLLDPAQVNDVVDVVLPIDVRPLDNNGHFELRRGFSHAAL